MRYKCQIMTAMGGVLLVLTDYSKRSYNDGFQVHTWFFPEDDVKVLDLQHVLELWYRDVSESTP